MTRSRYTSRQSIGLIVILLVLLSACDSGGSSGGTETVVVSTGDDVNGPELPETDPDAGPDSEDDGLVSEEDLQLARELTWLYDKMKTEYLWYDQTPDLDYLTFDTADELLEAMIDREQDRFSYLTTLEQNTASQTATNVTYGFRTLTSVQPFQVIRVYNGSSADDADVMRGDLITRIGDINIVDEQSARDAWALVSDRTDGSTLEFEFQRENVDEPLVHQLTASEVSRQTVDAALTRTDATGEEMGYLNIFEFRSKTDDELRSAFLRFQNNNVTSLIVDLRDNGGGSIRTIAVLGSLILGQAEAGKPFIEFRFSDLGETIFSSEGFITGYDLTAEDNAAPMRSVHIITSNRTCSASEILINSLSPYIPVSVSGTTTCGKPYGFYGRGFEDKSVLWAINFQSDNARGEGGWVNGIEPTCEVSDFQIFPYGDRRDRHLSSAVQYLETGACTESETLADSSTLTMRQSAITDFGVDTDVGQVRQQSVPYRSVVYNPEWTPAITPDRQR